MDNDELSNKEGDEKVTKNENKEDVNYINTEDKENENNITNKNSLDTNDINFVIKEGLTDLKSNRDNDIINLEKTLSDNFAFDKDETHKDEINKEEINKDEINKNNVNPEKLKQDNIEKEVDTNFRGNIYINESKKHKKRRIFSYIAVALIFSLLGGISGSFFMALNLRNDIYGRAFDSKNSEIQNIKIDLNDNAYYVTAVAEKAQKWVVGITALITIDTMFGRQKSPAVGSGFIVDPRGYILTNSHVVGDGKAEDIRVSLIDGTNEIAEVLWNDSTLDLAVIKINKDGLPAADLGDSGKLVIGEPVVAIGNPMTLDLDRTVTNGIVSGLNRSITVEKNIVIKPLIQTNASINPGNSGGPLLNAKGEVIGINTAKVNSAEGLGFSIPINTATPILGQIINEGSVSSAYIGISYLSVTNYEKRIGVDITPEYGVVIIEVVKDAPAEVAGLKSGDIIILLDNEKIEDENDIIRKLYQYKSGDKVILKILRDNEELEVEIVLKEKPKD